MCVPGYQATVVRLCCFVAFAGMCGYRSGCCQSRAPLREQEVLPLVEGTARCRAAAVNKGGIQVPQCLLMWWSDGTIYGVSVTLTGFQSHEGSQADCITCRPACQMVWQESKSYGIATHGNALQCQLSE